VSPVFVDTNVLVYSRDVAVVEKQERARAWMARLWKDGLGRLSTQVLQEFYVTATTKIESRLSPSAARAEIRGLLPWKPVRSDHRLFDDAWDIEDRYGFSFWDSMIVAAARHAGCEVLLTEDLQDGQVIDGLTVVNPFRQSPESILG
jgi:predicted nucleic acid-binding protein